MPKQHIGLLRIRGTVFQEDGSEWDDSIYIGVEKYEKEANYQFTVELAKGKEIVFSLSQSDFEEILEWGENELNR